MAAETIERQLQAAQEALRTAATATESLRVLDTMIGAAAELAESSGGTAQGGRLLDAAIAYFREAEPELHGDEDTSLAGLFLRAQACLMRDGNTGPVTDLDDAIECLRRLRAALPDGTPDRAEVDARLASALLNRCFRPGGRLTHLDEAGGLLASLPDDPGHGSAALLAVQRAVRYVVFGGAGADRDAALSYAATCMAVLPGPDGVASTGHLVTAWMTLTRQLTAGQRSAMLMPSAIEMVRTDAQAATSLLAGLGEFEIGQADAATAITHLRQVAAGPGNTELNDLLPFLWAIALLVTSRGDGGIGAQWLADARRVADQLGNIASGMAPESPEQGELLALRAVLLTAAAQAQGEAGVPLSATDSLSEAGASLPAGHYLRSPILQMLGQTLSREVAAAGSAPDAGARLTEIVAAMERMPPDDPAFAHALLTVGFGILSLNSTSRAAWNQDQLVSQFDRVASALAPDDPLRPLAQYTLCAARGLRGVLQHSPEIVDSVIEEMIRYESSTLAGHIGRPFMLAGIGVAYLERHIMGGEMRHLEQAEDFITRAFAEISPEGPLGEGQPQYGTLLYFRGHVRAVRCYYDPSAERAAAAVADLERAATLLDHEQGFSGAASTLEIARVMRDLAMAPADRGMYLTPETRVSFDRVLAAAERASRDSPEYPTLIAQAAAGLILRGLTDSDLPLIDRAISLIGEACSSYELTVRERPRLLEAHGQALLTRYSLTRTRSDLSNAIDRLEEARRAVEQEIGSPHTASVLQTLAAAYRTRDNATRGDVDRAVKLGLAALRENAGDVFLQDTDENALLVARSGVSDAAEMARWFLERGREAAAVSALELGRGMVLNAATWGAGVEEALRANGHRALADEWASWTGGPGAGQQGPDAGDTDLRYRVMLAIEGFPPQSRPLSPVALTDIATALTATGADALVYLLPRNDEGRGVAVIVDRDGTVRWLPLPGLYLGAGSPVTAFLRARRSAEAAGATLGREAAEAQWRHALTTLSGWAWQAAVGPVLNAIPARRSDQDRRVVLVPGGELGLVPWHAARRPDTSGRYSCHEVVFSYASSAQQFVGASRCLPRPWAQAPVLISDATESLYMTATGIGQLYNAHYPAATVFGFARDKLTAAVPGSPTPTRTDVLGALPHDEFPGATLLHLGCHGRVQVPALGSSLKIGEDKTGADSRVEVRDILRQARTRRGQRPAAGRSGGLVVLASCLTDVTERDFDEALSLATAFVSAGATGAVAARWRVGEAQTALFMSVFHQFLNGSCPAPARALRAAQLWMLNPDREVPDAWPRVMREEAAMAGHPDGPDLAGLEAWAGFAYQGR